MRNGLAFGTYDVFDKSKNTLVAAKNFSIEIAKIFCRYIHCRAIALVRKLFNVRTYLADQSDCLLPAKTWTAS